MVLASRARATRAARRRLAALQPTCLSWAGWHRLAGRAAPGSKAHARRRRLRLTKVRLRGNSAALRPVLKPRAATPPAEERAASPEPAAPKKRRGGPKLPLPSKEVLAQRFYVLNTVEDRVLVRLSVSHAVLTLPFWGTAADAYQRRRGAARAARRLSLQSGSARGGARSVLRFVRPHRCGNASAPPFLCCTRRSGQRVAAAPPALTQVLRRTLALASAARLSPQLLHSSLFRLPRSAPRPPPPWSARIRHQR